MIIEFFQFLICLSKMCTVGAKKKKGQGKDNPGTSAAVQIIMFNQYASQEANLYLQYKFFFLKHNQMYTLIVRLEALHHNSTICFTYTKTPSQGDINHQ